MSRADRVFKRLLRLFPAEFRGDFGDDMAATFSDQRRDVLARGGSMAALRLWWDTIRGVLTTAPREHLDLLRGDIRYALRNLRRNPGFTIVAVLALAVGIGANTAVFTIVNGVLLRALPYRHPGELVAMFEKVPGAPVDKFGFSPPDFEIVRDASRSYSGHVRVPQRDGRVVRRWGIPARRRDPGLARDVRRARRRHRSWAAR